MQKYYHTVYKLFITVITLTAFSALGAQQQIAQTCSGLTVVNRTTYYSGNGAKAASDCWNIFESMVQSKTACIGLSDAAFDITFKYNAGGDYYFWWPSLRTNDKDACVKLSLPSGVTTFTLEGFGKIDEPGFLYVSSANGLFDSTAISRVDEFSALSPGSITTSSRTVCLGGSPDNITEAVSGAPSGGSGTYTYEWYKNGIKINGVPDNSNIYTPAGETAKGEYKYTRKVIQKQCNVGDFSIGTYTLTVVDNPTVSIDVTGPGTVTICNGTAGGTLTANLFSADVGGPYTYTWQKWAAGAATWTDIGNETASTYAPGNLTDTTAFRVSATGLLGCAADFSTPSTITVYPAFAAGAFVPDAGGTVCVNGTPGAITDAIQDIAPAGSGSYTYAWYRNGNTGTSVSTDEYFIPSSETATGAVTYTRKVFDASCTSDAGMTAGSYILQVKPTPTVSLSTSAGTVCYNTPATIFTTMPVSGATKYEWASSTDDLTWGAATSTGASNSFTTTNLTTQTFYSLTVTVSDKVCPVAISAAPATITVRNAFSPGAITSATYTICVGGTPEQITGTTDASGGNEVMTYKWTYSYNGKTSVDINSNAADYTPSTEVTTNGAGTYHYQRWAIDGACQSTYTVAVNTYTLVVVAGPTMNNISVTGPGTATICNNTAGGTLTANLSSADVGGPYTYTWQKWEDGAWTA
jgi:hypothetical protein